MVFKFSSNTTKRILLWAGIPAFILAMTVLGFALFYIFVAGVRVATVSFINSSGSPVQIEGYERTHKTLRTWIAIALELEDNSALITTFSLKEYHWGDSFLLVGPVVDGRNLGCQGTIQKHLSHLTLHFKVYRKDNVLHCDVY